MFSIASLLDRAKLRAGIESDYRLAKVIGKPQATISVYRAGKTLPGEEITAQLCALSGDDPALIFVEIQAARMQTPATRAIWERVASKLSASAVLSVFLAALLVAGTPSTAEASTEPANSQHSIDFLYIVSITALCMSLLAWSLYVFSAPAVCSPAHILAA